MVSQYQHFPYCFYNSATRMLSQCRWTAGVRISYAWCTTSLISVCRLWVWMHVFCCCCCQCLGMMVFLSAARRWAKIFVFGKHREKFQTVVSLHCTITHTHKCREMVDNDCITRQNLKPSYPSLSYHCAMFHLCWNDGYLRPWPSQVTWGVV